MNNQLKEQLKEAAEQHFPHENSKTATLRREQLVRQLAFRDGAEWLWDEGYQFTRDDIIDFLEFYKFEFFKVNRILSLEDQRFKKGSEIEPIVVDLWIEKRSKSK